MGTMYLSNNSMAFIYNGVGNGTIQSHKDVVVMLIMWQYNHAAVQKRLKQSYVLAINQYECFAKELDKVSVGKMHIPITEPLLEAPLEFFQEGECSTHQLKLTVLRLLRHGSLALLMGELMDGEFLTQIYVYVLISDISQNSLLQKLRLNGIAIVKGFFCISFVGRNPLNLVICPPANIAVVPNEALPQRQPVNALKQMANSFFKDKKYVNALACYEICLSNCLEAKGFRERAIVYSNSAACFYEMRLLRLSRVYADLAIELDGSYPKGYIRKINCLLAMGDLGEVPAVMFKVKPHIDENELKCLANKYALSVSAVMGVYNWDQLMSHQNKSIGSYVSESIHKQSTQSRTGSFYELHAAVEQYQCLMVCRPLFLSSGSDKDTSIRQMTQYCRIDPQFYENLRVMAANLRQSSPNAQSTGLETSRQTLIAKCLVPYDNLECDMSELNDPNCRKWGFWLERYKFRHSCNPNCGYLFLRNSMLIFANQTIHPKEALTLDYMAYRRLDERRIISKFLFNKVCQCSICSLGSSERNQEIILTPDLTFGAMRALLIDLMGCSLKRKQIQHYFELLREQILPEDGLSLMKIIACCKEKNLAVEAQQFLFFLTQKYLKASNKTFRLAN